MVCRFVFLLFLSAILFSCANKYKAFESRYPFKSEAGGPIYNDLDYWAAHPWKWDPSDSIPLPLRGEPQDSAVDVFFLHPTTYTKKLIPGHPNAVIDDRYINAKTDYSTILYQASVFNQHCRVFAPRYRQAHISTFFKQPNDETEAIFNLAYQDIKAAFEYYLEHWNNGRPIIIASHSQGSKMAERLLKEFFEEGSLRNKLVVAYLAGWPVPKEYFSSLKMCNDATQTGCLCSWRTYRAGYIPAYLKDEKGNSFVTNPLTWTTSNEYSPRNLNKGSVLTKFNKVYPHTADARLSEGLLWIKRPKFPGSFLYLSKNYHPGDINLYYLNIRENVGDRIASYFRSR